MATSISLSNIVNTDSDRELPVIGFVCDSISVLTAISASLVQGVCAIVTLNSYDTLWHYNGTTWINSDPFYDTYANLNSMNFEGNPFVRGGNIGYATDTGQIGIYNAIIREFNWLS